MAERERVHKMTEESKPREQPFPTRRITLTEVDIASEEGYAAIQQEIAKQWALSQLRLRSKR